MKDRWEREITYLRISVTDRCNLRCVYCMQENCENFLAEQEILTADEIQEFVEAAVSMGIKKIRLTGGEPLVRKDIVDICRRISGISGVEELSLTTNGTLLGKYAKELKAAGVSRVNISLDTLQEEKYQQMTRRDVYKNVIEGIKTAVEEGLCPLKINTVLIGGGNDDEIKDFVELTREHPVQVRFIELMPIGPCVDFPKSAFVTSDQVLRIVPELKKIEDSGVSKMYQLPNGVGAVGIISPVNEHFCGSCNRIRLTCDGKIKPCLHSAREIKIKDLHGEELRQKICQAILEKDMQHADLTSGHRSNTPRNMNQIGG